MINKLPEVGKRYKHITSGQINKIKNISAINNTIFFEEKHPSGLPVADNFIDFFDYYEELPEPLIAETPESANKKNYNCGSEQTSNFYKISAISCHHDQERHKLLLENEGGVKFYATLPWFQERFSIVKKIKPEVFSIGYKSPEQEIFDKGVKAGFDYAKNKEEHQVDDINKQEQSIWKNIDDFPNEVDADEWNSGEMKEEKPMYEHKTVGLCSDGKIRSNDDEWFNKKGNEWGDLNKMCKEQSIWKSVDELPECGCDVLLNIKDRGINFATYIPHMGFWRLGSRSAAVTTRDAVFRSIDFNEIINYCRLDDFVGLKEHIRKLEGK